MRLFRHSLSDWWLLLLVPLGVVLVLFLPLALMMGGHLVGAILGPPSIWDRPRHELSVQELAGTYVEIKNNISNTEYENAALLHRGAAKIELKADHTAYITAVPQDDYAYLAAPKQRLCFLTGPAHWSQQRSEDEVRLVLSLDKDRDSDEHQPSCGRTELGLAYFGGQHRPFELSLYVGDPDGAGGLDLTQTLPSK